jgi:transmembrane sensor
MNYDRFWELVSLRMAGEAGEAELKELELLLLDNPEAGMKLERLQGIWETKHKSLLPQKKEAFNKHLQRLSSHLSQPVLQYENAEVEEEESTGDTPSISKRGRIIGWISGVAAALVIGFFFITGLPGSREENKPNSRNTVSTKKGSKTKIQLPDGTQVWLNADSRITYNENFLGNNIREVELTGEAFFNVVRDENHPFIIHTETIDVKVLGTSFNVRSYADESNTETALIKGSVEITLVKSPDKKKIILKPNDKLIVNNMAGTLAQEREKKVGKTPPVLMLEKVSFKKTDSNAVETLWVMNKLAFDDDPLEEIALKIERWYDVKVIITDETLRKESYTATFEDKTLKEVMDALQEGGGFEYVINKKEVLINKP